MGSIVVLKKESNRSFLRNIMVGGCSLIVLGTTLLNLAFSLAPETMMHVVRALIA